MGGRGRRHGSLPGERLRGLERRGEEQWVRSGRPGGVGRREGARCSTGRGMLLLLSWEP